MKPLSNTRRFLSSKNLAIANGRYAEDFTYLGLLRADPEKHEQCRPNSEELKSLNTFISLATRTIDIFSTHSAKVKAVKTKETKKTSNIRIMNKQLIYLEELSRRTAEELLIESNELRAQNTRLKSLLRQPPYHEASTQLDSPTLIRRAEKRIKNKNFRSARELLLWAYYVDPTNHYVLLRVFAASIRQPLLRTLLLLFTQPIKKVSSKKKER